MEMTVQVRGLSELARTCQQDLPDTIAKRCMRETLHAGGDVLAAAQEASAPVLTGAMKADIGAIVRVDPGAMGGYVVVGPLYNRAAIKPRRSGVVVSSDSPGVYDVFVERGHAPPGMAKEKRAARRRHIELEFGGRDTPPHPWVRPAWESSKNEALSVMLETLRETVSESVREAAK
jgi:HK97 gp10 family phage protein